MILQDNVHLGVKTCLGRGPSNRSSFGAGGSSFPDRKIRRPPIGVCGVKSCCTAVSAVLNMLCLVCCNCCLGATIPGRPNTPTPRTPRTPLHRGRWYLRGRMATSALSALLLLQACCRGYAARATLQGLCCRGYAAGAMLQELCQPEVT